MEGIIMCFRSLGISCLLSLCHDAICRLPMTRRLLASHGQQMPLQHSLTVALAAFGWRMRSPQRRVLGVPQHLEVYRKTPTSPKVQGAWRLISCGAPLRA